MFALFKRLPTVRAMQNTSAFCTIPPSSVPPPATEPVPLAKPKRRSFVEVPEKICSLPLATPVFPNSTPRVVKLSQLQQKFYLKYAPNYITSITYKALTDELKKSLPVKEHFCKVGTYCKIGYNRGIATLTGLYRVSIEEVKKLEIAEDANVSSELLPVPVVDDVIPSSLPLFRQHKSKVLDLLVESEEAKPKQSKQVDEFYSCRVSRLVVPPIQLNIEVEAKFRFLVHTYFKLFNQSLVAKNVNLHDAADVIDAIAGEMCERQYINVEEFHVLIETIDINQRIDRLQDILNKGSYFTKYLSELEKITQDRFRQRKFAEYYMEIGKLAKQAAEGKQAKELFIDNIKKAFFEKNPSPEIAAIFTKEIERYAQTDEQSSESTTIKSYVEELSKVPYNIQSTDVFDMKKAHDALESEHYGMKEVKDEILELISIGKLKGSLKGKIICLVGGPGLGKTTLASSIAKAMDRKFASISLGGVTDSSVLKGHRRTYIGAYSGKIIGALKQCGTNNPVILLDEIDKMGKSPQGDPSSELLEILDPAQNSSFTDNFLDVPVDLSNVLFVCSANYLQKVSKPLQDRMVKIRLTSYTNNEKKEIYQRHILRKAMEDVGLQPEHYEISPEVVDMLIHDYSLGEPGVRQLQKLTKKLLQKIVLKIVENKQPQPIKVNSENIVSYLGLPRFTKRDHTKIRKGVAIGIGDSYYGGRLTYIEAVKRSYSDPAVGEEIRSLTVTGSLGTIIKESMDISYTFARIFLRGLNNTFLYQNSVHLHAPSGASKKDGPNDAMAIVTALVSLATDKLPKRGVAMTGQLSLTGKVLKVSECKEKVLMCKRQGITELILPKTNRFEVEALTHDIKDGMTFHFVENYEQVYRLVFEE